MPTYLPVRFYSRFFMLLGLLFFQLSFTHAAVIHKNRVEKTTRSGTKKYTKKQKRRIKKQLRKKIQQTFRKHSVYIDVFMWLLIIFPAIFLSGIIAFVIGLSLMLPVLWIIGLVVAITALTLWLVVGTQPVGDLS